MIPDADRIAEEKQRRACFVLGTSIPDTELTDLEVIAGYKGQGAVECGFSFLKSPVFFVSSLFVKKPSRIVGLLLGLSSGAYRNHGDDAGVTGLFSGSTEDEKTVTEHRRDYP